MVVAAVYGDGVGAAEAAWWAVADGGLGVCDWNGNDIDWV